MAFADPPGSALDLHMNLILRIGLISAFALAACKVHVSGDGVLGEEQRTVAPFTGVDISLGAEATVTANASKQSVTISVDENLLQYIKTPVVDSVQGSVLEMRLSGTDTIDSVHPLRLVAQAKKLDYVRATEASNVDVKGAGDPTFEVVAAGLSYVTLAGPGGDILQVNLSGGSSLDAWSYPAAGANVLLSGASTLRVNSVSDVVGTIADTSSVDINGGGTCAALTLAPTSTCTSH